MMNQRKLYPRLCDECNNVYKNKSSYYVHRKHGTCKKNQDANQLQAAQTSIQTQNNHCIQNNINNHNHFHITIKNEFTDWLQSTMQGGDTGLTQKEKRQVGDVLHMLHQRGYTTRNDVQKLVMEEFTTVQQLQQQINEYDLDVLRNIISSNIPNKAYNVEEHASRCTLSLFKRLISTDEAAISPDTLKTNPLFQPAKGQLSAWFASVDDLEPYGGSKFGDTFSKKRQWNPLHHHTTWMSLIEMIGLRFEAAIKSGGDWKSSAEEALLVYWTDMFNGLTSDKPELMKALATELAAVCRNDHTRGWHNLSKLISRGPTSLDVTDDRPNITIEAVE